MKYKKIPPLIISSVKEVHMKKTFFEDSAMAMAKLIVESIYHGMEENEGVYADLMYSNGKGQHGWAHIFQNEHEHLTKAGYRVVLMVSGSWKYAVAYDPHSKTAIMILRQENFRNRLVKLQNGEMHYVFSGLPANQDLNEMVPQYEQMSLFGQDKAVQQKAEKPFDELEQAVDGEVLRFGILTYRLDLAQLIRSCTLEILNANGCIVDEMNLDSAIPMNWKEAVPEDEITKFKEETGNEYGVQIDSIPEFKPRKKFVRKDG